MKDKPNLLLVLEFISVMISLFIIYFLKYNKLALLLLFISTIVLIILSLFEKNKIRYNISIYKKAIVYADIVNFKLLKLYYGKRKTKKITKKVYNIILNNLKKGCVVKKNNDHYSILVEYKNKSEIINLINFISEESSKVLNDEIFNLTLKYGIQICIEDDYETNENKASLACIKAKNEPMKTYCFYDEGDTANLLNEKKVVDSLINALINEEFEVYFQPKYDYKKKEIIGSEALIRLIQNNRIVPAHEFIDVAEKYGFTVALDKYVLVRVCKKINELKKEKINFKCISINVSRNTLRDEKIIEYYSKVLNQYNIDKNDIELEITERKQNDDEDDLSSIIHKLSKKFNVSIDDFGVGYSSLEMLNENSIKTIKIDRKFVVNKSDTGKKILKNIINLCNSLNFNLIAEGVETEEQFNYLKNNGCTTIQGYYYEKPLPFDEYVELLKKNK